MKKVLIAMLAMFLLIVFPLSGIWQIFSKLIGGGAAESFIYPIYGGIILLAGLIAGCTVIILEEIKSLKEEIRNSKTERTENDL